jgi:serine/threonine protein kinase
MKPDYTTGGLRRVSAFFYVLSLHHRTLQDVVLVQHPEQRPLPFRYVIAVVSGIADALEAAAEEGLVHLDMKEDNVMVDDPEAMDFEAEQIAADATVVDYRQCHRRFEEPPEAVVVDWGVGMQFDDEWVLRVPVVDGKLVPPDDAQLWGNPAHASPELQVEWKRAGDELERAKGRVREAHQAKAAAVERTSSEYLHRCCVA